MASRDVKMVISATDKASAASNAVKDALLALQDAQKGTVQSSGQTSSALQAFGGALNTLQNSLRGKDVGEQLEDQFDKARAAVGRMEDQLAETSRQQDEYKRRSKEAKVAIEAERKSVVELTAALLKERTVRGTLRTELNRANRSVSKTLSKGDAPSQEQITAARRAEEAFVKQATAVQKLEVRLAAVKGKVSDLVREENRLANQAEVAGESLDGQSEKLVSARVGLLKLGEQARMAESALKEFGRTSTTELDKVLAAQRKITSQAGFDAGTAQAGVAPSEQAFLEAQAAADKYHVALGEGAEKTRTLRAESDRLEKAFQDQKNLAAALQQEYEEQQQTLARLSAITRETADDVNAIADRQARFTAEQNRGQRAVEKIRGSVTRYQTSIAKAAEKTRRLAADQQRLAAVSRTAATGQLTLAGALRKFFGEGKRALSITQRLRGQVLSLATQYVGFFAVFQGIGAVIGSVQKLEGATNSLAAVFDGDFDKVNGELDFLRRNADRLGIGFGQLSDDYSKFAAATKNTPIQDETRAIFIRVAEAGRVLNLTADQMSGTLTALSQIASKGTVSMEELRQQLGDRLPGALQIMADGVGVTSAELIKLIENGELSSTALVGFAGELEKRFGPQLGGSLGSLNAELGRFTNAAFEAQIAFANGGFLEGFTGLVRTATETIKSADFQTFLENLGRVISGAFSIASVAVKNFQIVFTGLVAFAAAKALPVVIGTIASFGNFAVQLQRTAVMALAGAKAYRAGAISLAQMGSAAGKAAVSVGVLANTTKTALISTGLGVAVVAIGVVMAALSTQADDTAEALKRQGEVVDDLKNKYDSGTRKAEEFAEALDKITLAEARENIRALTAEAKNLEANLDNVLTGRGVSGQGSGIAQLFDGVDGVNFANLFGANRLGAKFTREFAEELKGLAAAFEGGAISAMEFERAVAAAAENQDLTDSENRKLIKTVELIEENIEVRRALGTAVQLNEVKIKQLRGELELADVALITAANSTDALGASLNALEVKPLADALAEISKEVPTLAAELKKTEKLESLGATLEAAGLSADIAVLTRQVESYGRTAAAVAGIPIVGEAAKRSAEEAQEVLDAYKQALEEINKPKATGRQKRDPFAEARKKLLEAIDSDEQTLQLDELRRQGDELGAVLQERANFVNGILSELSVDQQKTLAEELGTTYENLGRRLHEATRADDARQGLDDLLGVIKDAQAELATTINGDDTAVGRERNFTIGLVDEIAGIREEMATLDLTPLEAQEAEKGIERLKEIRQAQFALEESERTLSDARQAAQNALSVVNDLEERRTILVERLGVALQQNNEVEVSQLQGRINDLDVEISSAEQSARELLENVVALGGDEAITALERLNNKVGETGQIVSGTQVTVKQIADVVANNLTDAVSQFAEAVANGQKPLKALKDAMRQFASDTLIEIGRVIARALIMQAVLGAFGLAGAGGGTGSGTFVKGIVAKVAHTGQTGGKSGNRSRTVNPSVFAGAPKFHQGRTGLSTGEMAAIIKTDEDVLTRDNPFHSANLGKTVRGLQGGGGQSQGDVKIVNVVDPAEMLDAALSDTPGQRVLINHIRREAEAINAALDG